MASQEVLEYIDNLFFSQTKKHLDSLQVAILKGVSQGQKYAEIAANYKCTKGHVKDEAYKLWHILSEVLGEDINKSNFSATIERLGAANFNSPIVGNRFKVGHVNFYGNSSREETTTIDDNLEGTNHPNSSNTVKHDEMIITQAQKQIKLNTIPKLVKIGLTAEQIAEMLELSLEEVQETI